MSNTSTSGHNYVNASNKQSELPGFMQKQYEFASHIRNPDSAPRPADVEARRMDVYNEVFYNNVEDFMASSFPVLRSLMDDDRWHALIRQYYDQHRASTPLFPEMPREFLKYLENEYQPRADDLPFMLELAHYEWVELALSFLDQDPETEQLDQETDLLNAVPVLSPLAWPLQYQYPVQKIGPDFIPEAPGESPTLLLVYRDAEDDIHFLTINMVTARLLGLLQQQQALSGLEILQNIAEELQHPDPQAVIDGGLQILQDLYQRGVILGSTSSPR